MQSTKFVCTSCVLDKKTGEFTSRISPALEYEKEDKKGFFIQADRSVSVAKELTLGQIIEIDFTKLIMEMEGI